MKKKHASFHLKKMLFVGLSHTARDSRLCAFQAKSVRARYPNVECLYLGIDSVNPRRFSNENMTVIEMPRGINPLKRRFRLDDMAVLARHIQNAGIDLVQISDARELMLGHALKKWTSIPVIYDSHEDYFNQKYEYLNKSIKGLIQGTLCRANEILNVRYMDAVFCTDEFLQQLYRMPLFAAKTVTMMRNIPLRETIRSTPVIHQRDELKLVYLGSVNRLRGIIEVAEYCARFNLEDAAARQGLSLSFHVFSNSNDIIDDLSERGRIVYRGYAPQKEIEREIQNFDIGVSLLLPCKKFARNIPIKNFEYMAMGLPILTSDFGTMKQYVGEARAGVMVDPTSYTAFRDGVLMFKDRDFRRACGENGLAYARQHFHRDAEAAVYLDTVGSLLGVS